MTDKRKIIAVIPSRKGSKGLPRKGIKSLCGKPLLAYTIEQAIESECFDRVIVSTDCEQIAAVAGDFGAEVPFLRPAHLATDESYLRIALNHLLDELAERESYHPDVMAVMFPTYPFRTLELIRRVVRGACEEAIWAQCVSPTDINPGMLVSPGEGEVWPMQPVIENDTVTQEAHNSRRFLLLMGTIRAEVVLPKGIRNGEGNALERAAYLDRKAADGDNRFVKKYLNIVVDDPILRIDINNESDFLLAERVLKRGLFNPETVQGTAQETVTVTAR
ncbi:MAG: acylneuraminate cytidylyltransferase family protein [Planctomycetota bacterium]